MNNFGCTTDVCTQIKVTVIATDNENRKQINSDKVHECSFKNQVGQTFIGSSFKHTHTIMHTSFKWLRQSVSSSETETSHVCVKQTLFQSHDTQQNQPLRVLTMSGDVRQPVWGGSQVFSVLWINSEWRENFRVSLNRTTINWVLENCFGYLQHFLTISFYFWKLAYLLRNWTYLSLRQLLI